MEKADGSVDPRSDISQCWDFVTLDPITLATHTGDFGEGERFEVLDDPLEMEASCNVDYVGMGFSGQKNIYNVGGTDGDVLPIEEVPARFVKLAKAVKPSRAIVMANEEIPAKLEEKKYEDGSTWALVQTSLQLLATEKRQKNKARWKVLARPKGLVPTKQEVLIRQKVQKRQKAQKRQDGKLSAQAKAQKRQEVPPREVVLGSAKLPAETKAQKRQEVPARDVVLESAQLPAKAEVDNSADSLPKSESGLSSTKGSHRSYLAYCLFFFTPLFIVCLLTAFWGNGIEELTTSVNVGQDELNGLVDNFPKANEMQELKTFEVELNDLTDDFQKVETHLENLHLAFSTFLDATKNLLVNSKKMYGNDVVEHDKGDGEKSFSNDIVKNHNSGLKSDKFDNDADEDDKLRLEVLKSRVECNEDLVATEDYQYAETMYIDEKPNRCGNKEDTDELNMVKGMINNRDSKEGRKVIVDKLRSVMQELQEPESDSDISADSWFLDRGKIRAKLRGEKKKSKWMSDRMRQIQTARE